MIFLPEIRQMKLCRSYITLAAQRNQHNLNIPLEMEKKLKIMQIRILDGCHRAYIHTYICINLTHIINEYKLYGKKRHKAVISLYNVFIKIAFSFLMSFRVVLMLSRWELLSPLAANEINSVSHLAIM